MKSKFGFPIAILLVMSLSSFEGCNKYENLPYQICAQKATFRNNLCGVGLWGAYVLELENGEIVQPWDAPTEVGKFVPLPNQEVRITVATVARDGRYDNLPVCMAFGPFTDKIARQVRIECLTIDGSK
jgi:hypothetical protein